MILQSLYKLYSRLKDDPEYQIAEPGYSLQKISFKVVLKPNGELFDIQDARVISDKGKKITDQVKVLGKGKPSGSGINPCFLWDNAAYMLGYKKLDGKLTDEKQEKEKQRTKECSDALKVYHLKLENEINSDTYSTVCRFFESWDPSTILDDEGNCKYPILDETGFGIFQIIGEMQYVHENKNIIKWWNENLTESKGDSIYGQCLLTGGNTEIARLQPKIKGISGGKAEASLVSFNERSYESYAKEQSYNAPVSEDAAFKYGVALNALLDGPMKTKHRLSLGDSTIVFWTDKPTFIEDIFAKFASEGAISTETKEVQDGVLRQRMESFLRSLKSGTETTEFAEDDIDFYMLGLSPNAARVSVRFFYQSTVADLIEKLRQHFSDIKIERQWKENSKNPDPEFPSFWSLLRQTARDSKEISPILSAPLLRAVIQGISYPQGIYSAVMRRVKTVEKDQNGKGKKNVTYLRACVIKGYLNRNKKMEVSMSLDIARKDPAYRLGRLFATLEKTQSDALGNVGAGLRERFYSSASATPGTVFPRILRTYQHHLGKLEGGRKVNREKLIQEIMDPLNDFPSHLNLNEQGLFAIGYYHQIQSFFTKNEDKQNQED